MTRETSKGMKRASAKKATKNNKANSIATSDVKSKTKKAAATRSSTKPLIAQQEISDAIASQLPTAQEMGTSNPKGPNYLQEAELELAARNGLIKTLTVHEIDETPSVKMEAEEGETLQLSYFMSVTFHDPKDYRTQLDKQGALSLSKAGLLEWYAQVLLLLEHADSTWYLTTRRTTDSPRIFKDLNRLNEYLLKKYPTDSYTLLRNAKLP